MNRRVTISKTIAEANVKERPGVRTKALQSSSQTKLGQLQNRYGNRAVQRMLASGVLQAKLTIGRPGDRYEREADRVADRVVSMPDANISRKAGDEELQTKPVADQITPLVQREPKEEEEIQKQPEEEEESVQAMALQRQPNEEEEVQKQPEDEEETAQAKSDRAISTSLSPSVENQITSIRGGGQPLSASSRAYFEPRFGTDFSSVRVHTDTRAGDLAKSIQAKAFTVGRDVVFGSGEYAPESSAGKRLMAHELTHVAQQTRTRAAVQRKIEVNSGLDLDTMGYTTSKSGNTYTCPKVVKSSIWHEIFTSLFHSPRTFKLAGNTNTKINKNFKKHMSARHGILKFASKKKYTFGAGANFKMNPAYWDVSSGLKPKAGVDPYDAINDLNVHPEEYSIACLAATLLTMLGGSKSSLVADYGAADDDWIPGDWGYITNTNFPSGGTPGLEGENIIYTGKDKFWGHFGPGNEYKKLQEWYDQVEGWHGAANIESSRQRPTEGLE